MQCWGPTENLEQVVGFRTVDPQKHPPGASGQRVSRVAGEVQAEEASRRPTREPAVHDEDLCQEGLGRMDSTLNPKLKC